MKHSEAIDSSIWYFSSRSSEKVSTMIPNTTFKPECKVSRMLPQPFSFTDDSNEHEKGKIKQGSKPRFLKSKLQRWQSFTETTTRHQTEAQARDKALEGTLTKGTLALFERLSEKGKCYNRVAACMMSSSSCHTSSHVDDDQHQRSDPYQRLEVLGDRLREKSVVSYQLHGRLITIITRARISFSTMM